MYVTLRLLVIGSRVLQHQLFLSFSIFSENSGYMNLTFTGFFHGSGPVNGDLSNSKKSTLLVEDFIKVDVLLVKVCHKRRKESESQVLTVPLGQGSAPFNPRSQLLPVSPSASVSVPNGTFKSGKTSRTCILSLQVSVPYRVSSKGVTKKGRKKKKAGEFIADAAADENGVNDNLTPDEPPAKRRRVARGSPQGEWDDGNVSENSNSCETEHTVYTAELIVFDNNKHCLLTDGDYELALSEKHKRPGRKNCRWIFLDFLACFLEKLPFRIVRRTTDSHGGN